MALTTRRERLRWIASNRFHRIVREFFWIAFGQAAAVIGALIGVRLLTRLLDPTAYGQLALGMTVAVLVNQVVLGPLSGGATRFYAPARESNSLNSNLAAVCNLTVASTGGILLISVLFGIGVIAVGAFQWVALGVAAVCYALLSGYNAILSGIQNAARQRVVVAFHQGLESWGRFLVASGLMIWLGATSTIAMLGYALSMLVVLTSQFLFFRHSLLSIESADRTETITDHQWRTRILTYSWPFATWGIFTWVQSSSDRWALQVFSSTQDVGLYAVLYQVAYYPTIILVGLTVQLVSPMLFQRAGDACDLSRMRQVHIINRRLTVGALLLTAIAVLCAFALHGLIFDWLVAPDYRAVSWLMPGVVLASGLSACGQVAAISLLSGTETRILIAPKIATALVGVLLNIVGAALWGIVGVVFAGVVTAVMYLVWIWFLTFRSRR